MAKIGPTVRSDNITKKRCAVTQYSPATLYDRDSGAEFDCILEPPDIVAFLDIFEALIPHLIVFAQIQRDFQGSCPGQ